MADFIPHGDLIRDEMEFEKRHERRAMRHLLVSYRSEGEVNRPQLTTSVDVSRNGMSIWTRNSLRRDAILALSICTPGSLEVFRARARVCWSRVEEGKPGVRTGLSVVSSAATSGS